MNYAKMIGSIVNLVWYTLNMKMDQENTHYSRFITYVKFFVERFYESKLLSAQMANLYPEAIDVAFKIKDYINQVHSIVISNAELTYLMVHIHRFISYQQLKKMWNHLPLSQASGSLYCNVLYYVPIGRSTVPGSV